jgi:hypothetical protein
MVTVIDEPFVFFTWRKLRSPHVTVVDAAAAE